MHGGKGSGAPEGNRNAFKHGARSAETREALVRRMARLLGGRPWRHGLTAGAFRISLAGVCNLYRLTASREEIVGLFGATDRWQADLGRDHVAPGLEGPVIIA